MTSCALILPLAHLSPETTGPRDWSELARAWSFDPFVVVLLAATAWVYARGVKRLRAAVGHGRGLRGWETACFRAGWWTLVVALVSPLHPWGQVLFTAHMTQHELLMLVAAPLLVLGRPVVAVLFALPRHDARDLARRARNPRFQTFWRGLTHPLAAWLIHAFALWIWHVPSFFEATLRYEWVHHFQHASFFGSALLFWWALFHARAGLRGFGAATLYLFTTMMHSGLLGALILFADTLVYPAYAATAGDWSLTPLEDQQLGGLIMWVPAGLVYVVAALALVIGWLRAPDAPARWHTQRPALTRAATFCLCLLLLGGCTDRRQEEAARRTGGDPAEGRRLIKQHGCVACHTIPGVHGARAVVGPSLAGVGDRRYLGGVLANEPENMIRWLLDPRAHNPRTAMPDVVESEDDARHIAAYLYTLRD